jgi:hypothetical protein
VTPKAKYRMRCIRYWPATKIDSGGHGGSMQGEIDMVYTVVGGADGDTKPE